MNQLYYQDEIKKYINEITGFNVKDIELICSSKEDENTQLFDCHEFKYKNKVYILKKDKLIIKKCQ